MARVSSLGPNVHLLSAGKGVWSVSTPLYCQIEKSQGSEKTDPDLKPALLSLVLGRSCVFV